MVLREGVLAAPSCRVPKPPDKPRYCSPPLELKLLSAFLAVSKSFSNRNMAFKPPPRSSVPLKVIWLVPWLLLRMKFCETLLPFL